MKHFTVFILIFLLFATSQVKSQCYTFKSPDPMCTSVLDNGDLKVFISRGSMGGVSGSADLIDRIELEYSTDGNFFNPVSVISIGIKWPHRIDLIHENANVQMQTGYYRTVAYCDTVTNYALPMSEMIKSVKLEAFVNSNNDVDLSWNYDEKAENMLVIINRKQFNSTKWDSIKTMPLIMGNMSYTDTTLSKADTFIYRIDFINLDNFCQGNSSEDLIIYQPETKPNSVKEIDDPQINIWPNPVGELINISFSLKESQNVSVEILNIQGQSVYQILGNSYQSAGLHSETLQMPPSLKSGMYLLKISAGSNVHFKRFAR